MHQQQQEPLGQLSRSRPRAKRVQKLSFIGVAALLLTLLLPLLPLQAFAQQPSISLAPSAGAPGDRVSVIGSGWTAGETVFVSFDVAGRHVTQVTPVASNFIADFVIPNVPNGAYKVIAGTEDVSVQSTVTFTVTPPKTDIDKDNRRLARRITKDVNKHFPRREGVVRRLAKDHRRQVREMFEFAAAHPDLSARCAGRDTAACSQLLSMLPGKVSNVILGDALKELISSLPRGTSRHAPRESGAIRKLAEKHPLEAVGCFFGVPAALPVGVSFCKALVINVLFDEIEKAGEELPPPPSVPAGAPVPSPVGTPPRPFR